MIGVLAGTHVLLVGVEPHPEGGVKAYLGERRKGIYVWVPEGPDAERVQRAWNSASGHIEFPKPPIDALYRDQPEVASEPYGSVYAEPEAPR